MRKDSNGKGGSQMNHDEYWKKVMDHAEETLCGLFEGSRTRVRDIVGDDNGIDDDKDVKAVLAYVLGHGDCSEKACAILASCAWSQAMHELDEHRGVTAAGAAAQ